ncbi:MAG: DUF2267 domain-containing protein [Planctomycetaceae bacterium]|nr:MAG: DUF2267 domain-containing protein [Planctomycetaceae bacterium]
MSAADIPAFQSTLQTTNDWLKELSTQMGRDDSQQAYRVLRAVLMALRDRLTVEEATDLAAQLPTLIRGFYYEGWNPSKTPTNERDLASFLERVSRNLTPIDGDPGEATRAVFKMLSTRITAGEIEHVKSNLPTDVQTLWA